jgi:TP901 family phage tail tape measure protein
MPDFVVSTAFTAKDGITPVFKEMSAGATKFGNKASSAFSRAASKATSFKAITKGILAAGAVQKGLSLMQQGVRGVISELVLFDDAVTQAAAKFPDQIKRGSNAFKELQATAREVGKNTKFSATEAAEGLNFLAMAGFNAEQAMAALPQVTDLAVVAGTDLAQATDIASDALGAFGLMTKDSAKLTENLARINDVFAKTTTTANTNLEMIFETMKDAGPVITGAGQSVETFAALTGELANAGIKGSKAGTTLKNMFLQLQAATPKAKAKLKELNIEIEDEQGNLKDMITLIGEFQKSTANMGKAQKAAALDTIFGRRAIAGVNVLLDAGEDKLKAYREQLEASRGSANTMAKDIEKSLGNKLKALKSAAIEIGLQFFDSFEKQLPGAIDAAIEAVRTFDMKPIVEGVKSFFKALKEIWLVLQDLKPAIEAGIVLWLSYIAAVKYVAFLQLAAKAIVLVSALQKAAAAQGILNAVMLANPIGLVTVAIGLAIAAIVLWIKNWKEIVEVSKFVWEELKEGWRKGVAFISGLWDGIMEKVKTFLALVRKGKEFFTGKDISLEVEQRTKRVAPNAEKEAARREREKIGFEGRLTVAGAPPGSTLEATTTGAPPIKAELLGANL